jgi:hypothetical protein
VEHFLLKLAALGVSSIFYVSKNRRLDDNGVLLPSDVIGCRNDI